MRKALCLVSLSMLVFCPLSASAYDSEALANVGKAIADAQLVRGQETHRTPAAVTITGSLANVAKAMDGSRGKKGWANHLDSNGDFIQNEINTEIQAWKINKSSNMTIIYESRLPDESDAAVAAGGDIVTAALGSVCAKPEVFSMPATAISTTNTFFNTVHYAGTSMQVMNPPIYLQEKTLSGSHGMESFALKSWPNTTFSYNEAFSTIGPNPITRVHTEKISSPFGYQITETRIQTPAANNFERFMNHHFPTGSYWSPDSTTSCTRQGSFSYRAVTTNGVTTFSPLPASTTMPAYTPPPSYTPPVSFSNVSCSSFSMPPIHTPPISTPKISAPPPMSLPTMSIPKTQSYNITVGK